VHVGGTAVAVVEAVPRGHKLALCEIQAGEPVVKYGSAIGVASATIPRGGHVHTHNLASARGRGDLAITMPPGEGRLAEPPDDGPEAPAEAAASRPRRT
jgi:altronate dehydratase